jgi:hypothetical protein
MIVGYPCFFGNLFLIKVPSIKLEYLLSSYSAHFTIIRRTSGDLILMPCFSIYFFEYFGVFSLSLVPI